MTLHDAEKITSTDVRFPTTPQVAAEKLWGWSILIDLFHGIAHDIANNVRNFVITVGPALHRIAEQSADNPAQGMDYVCRVLYEAQQDYFAYVKQLATNRAAVAPTFSHITNAVSSHRVQSLSELPSSWYLKLEAPSAKGKRNPAPSARSLAGVVATFNANPDSTLMRRFRSSGHPSISAMMQGHDAEIPKHSGKQVCLVWALKGECSASCKRKEQHVRYAPTTNKAIHSLMDACGVANSQE